MITNHFWLEGSNMKEQYRVVKISYSEELSAVSELWVRRFIEKSLLNHIAKDDYKLQALLIKKI